GPFSHEQRDTAPPWSVGWLVTPSATVEHPTDGVVSTPRGGMAHGEQDHLDPQKKKLFVGMAPKSAYEEDYRAVFAPFGKLVDIYVIRDRNGFSKGCAFVRYESAQSANDAIDALHDKHIMPGGFRTLVVTIADDRRSPHAAAASTATCHRDTLCSEDGLSRSLSRPASFLGGDGGGGGTISSTGSIVGPHRSSAPAPQTGAVAFGSTVAQGSTPAGVLPGMPYFLCGGNPPQGTYVYYPYVPPSCSQPDAAVSVAPPEVSTKSHHAPSIGSHGVANVRGRGARGVQENGYVDDGTVRRFSSGGPEEKGRRWAKQSVGPTGANLFVYYLPGSLTDADLATAFSPFGEVLSAKVYYDRDTGESKGFGFVSYSTPEEAEAAISGMNGFFIGQKRLKVVRKRGQQADRYTDGGTRRNGRGGDFGYAGSNSASGMAQAESGDVGHGGIHPPDDDNVTSEISEHRTLNGNGFQENLDFFSPEGLLGQSMAR
ncbi:unnamed protein product, partial [Scytosiphon promiscuus]